jgi:hypothetical protein
MVCIPTKIMDIAFEAYGKAHNCLRIIDQFEFNYQGIMVGSSYFDRERFNEFQPSVVDVVDIMAKDSGSIVFPKSYRFQIYSASYSINNSHAFIIPGVEITGNYKWPLVF